MKPRLLVIAALLCASLAHANDDVLVAETKKTAMGIPPKLLAMLQAEIEKGNFSGAVVLLFIAKEKIVVGKHSFVLFK